MEKKKIELLAPAGNYEAFIQAINNGADAVYMAGKNFNARSFAQNFTIEEIGKMIEFAHSRDVKVYVTVNTLIKDSEIMDALKFVESLYKHNVDAILVQDLGLINILHKAYPDLTLHASTQMNCTCVNDAKRLKELGMKRIVLARECAIETIKEIKENVDIELEVFCHGALCMSYSGNCLMSSLIGGRSGNRGKCAQSCRQEYVLEYSDNNSDNGVKEIDKKYYLSCKDLMTFENINELKNIRIDSLKIEGRGKESYYVGTVTKWYREAIDKPISQERRDLGVKELKLVYNRKFTKGYLFNETNKLFTNIETVNHLGIEIGKVVRADKQNIYIELKEDLNIEDAIRVIDNKDNTKDAIIVNNMYECNRGFHQLSLIKNAKKGMLIKLHTHNEELRPGLTVLKTKDSKVVEEALNVKEKKISLNCVIYIKNNRLCLDLSYNHIKVTVSSEMEVQAAKNADMKDRIIDQIKKLGDTQYSIDNIKYIGEAVFLPIKEINELRRQAIETLETKMIESMKKDYHFNKFSTNVKEYNNEPRLYAKVLNKAQANACIDAGIKYIISEDNEIVKELEENNEDVKFIYMPPRLAKENAGIGSKNNEKISSVYLNIFNIFAVNKMHEDGINIVGISPELSKKEIVEIVNRYVNTFKKKPNLLMEVYGRYEMMIMKHCPVNKALGLDNKGCGECLRKQYFLKDKKDYEFPLVRTINCNMKVLNSRTTSLIDYLKDIKKIGINNLLLDFTLEDYSETFKVASNYKECFCEDKNGYEDNPYTTHGTFENGIE